MKAALIAAVAIGGATAAALTWTYVATSDPDPLPGGLADAPVVLDGAPAGPGASAPPARVPTDPRRAGPASETRGAVPSEASGDLASRDRPAPSDSAMPGASPDRLAAVTPEAPAAAAPPPGAAARDPAKPDAPRMDAAPSFDVVRVDAGGQTVIAGRAAPNERVEVLLDGRVVETMLADAGGRFVAVLSTGQSASARELRLRVTLPAQAPPANSGTPHERTGGTAAEAPEPGRVVRSGPARPAGAPGPAPAGGPGDGSTATSMPPQPASPSPPVERGAGSASPEGPGPLAAGQPAPSVPPGVPSAPSATGDAGPTAAAHAGALTLRADPEGGRYLLSDPVIILPTERTGDAPALVRVQDERLALLQPGGAEATGVLLDQLTREPGGDLLLLGRARPGHAVRIYGNDKAIDTVPVSDGSWSLTVPESRAGDIRLFRLDEIARSGAVASRIEVPFQPSNGPSQILRDRRITVQRGDNLWRIAEQHYGEGIRYSLIFGANSDLIRDPDLIYPDQVFTVPELVEAE